MSASLASTGERTEPFRVRVHWHQCTATVAIGGELDYATAPILADRLTETLASQPTGLILDLASLTFIDCAGISPIAVARQRLPAEAPLILRDPSPAARKLFRLTRIDQICGIDCT